MVAKKTRYSRTTIISEGNISNVTDMSISFEREWRRDSNESEMRSLRHTRAAQFEQVSQKPHVYGSFAQYGRCSEPRRAT